MSSRPLTPAEAAEAQAVFAAGLDYSRVRVIEEAAWPNWLASLGARLGGRPAPQTDNAVTLDGRMFFPRRLQTAVSDLASGNYGDMAWLMHELTHVWQSQREGPGYLLRALRAQIALGPRVYDYGGEAGLAAAIQAGKTLADFNVEQQADIARDYYRRLRLGQSVGAWQPFVEVLRQPAGSQ